MPDTTNPTIRLDVIRSVWLLVGAAFIGEAAVLLAAVVTDASFGQLTLAAAGPPALVGAILLFAFHGLKGPAAVACAALGVFGVGFIAGLNDWVFANVVARVVMAGTGVALLGWGLARAVERPAFSWKALRGVGVPSVVSGGLLIYGDADWVGEPRPGHVRVQVGPDTTWPARRSGSSAISRPAEATSNLRRIRPRKAPRASPLPSRGGSWRR